MHPRSVCLLVGDNLLGILIKYVNLLNIQMQILTVSPGLAVVRGIYSCSNRELFQIEVQIYFSTQQLVYTGW